MQQFPYPDPGSNHAGSISYTCRSTESLFSIKTFSNCAGHSSMDHLHKGVAHKHSHSAEFGSLNVIGVKLFPYEPLPNAVFAVTIITAITQTLIQCSPPLSGLTLQFLVAFAEGGMLGTIFVHTLPEINLTISASLCIISGFLIFVMMDKVVRIISGNSSSHSHSHSHEGPASPPKPSDSEPQKKTKNTLNVQSEKTKKDTSTEQGLNMRNLGPIFNVIADSLHNLTDGVSLAMAFRQGAAAGFTTFLIMCCHEIPHQFGDFALLINSGRSKASARKLQLITALGTLTGCILGNFLGGFGDFVEELITPLTAGVLLYVAMVNVLPELLEVDTSKSRRELFTTGLVHLVGIVLGISMLFVVD
nr:ZPT71 [Starmerella bombicola]